MFFTNYCMSKTEKDTKSSKKAESNKRDNSSTNLAHGLFLPTIDESNLKNTFGNKAITIYGTAKILKINASTATRFLNDLESKNLITKVGGYSGHYVWKII